jgi:hypothetical protein
MGTLGRNTRVSGLHYSQVTRMKNFLGIFFFVLLIVSPTFSFGITFDIWETGMSINEVVGLARQHDIPIARESVYHASKGFDPKLIDDKFYKASVLYYRTTISGRSSIVYLRLTDDPKFIAEIDVRLLGITDRELFIKEMLGILMQKYGRYKERKEPVFQVYEWRPDQFSQIWMKVFGPEASIIYTDLRIKELLENQRREKERKSIKKDAGKF